MIDYTEYSAPELVKLLVEKYLIGKACANLSL
jgi:hypothetical protein